MNPKIEEIAERAYDDYCNGDTYPIRDAIRQAAREAWQAATQAQQEENARLSAQVARLRFALDSILIYLREISGGEIKTPEDALEDTKLQAVLERERKRDAVIEAAKEWAEKGKTAIKDEPTDALVRAIFALSDLEED